MRAHPNAADGVRDARPPRRRRRLGVTRAACLATVLAASPLAAEDGKGAEGAVAATPADAPAEQKVGERRLHEYPTAVIADYVLGCMAANGNTHEALQQCSCSIDFIRERMDYPTYERAATIMQIQLDRGQRGIFYRDSSWAKSRIETLEDVQAESTLRCF